MLDLAIRGGLLLDGSGDKGRLGDLGIKDGRIVSVGGRAGAATRTIDAEGAMVSPGFIDIHTHYDVQVSWDAELMPSACHGVTTAVMGSCGVGFAPVRARDRDRLIRLMEGVEDIPGSALHEGISWEWETFDEYLSAIDFPHSMDLCAQITHDPVRVYVMGERALANESATDEDIGRMRAVIRAALEAGAAGFSTGRTDNHRNVDGAPTPSSEACARELEGLAMAFRGFHHGVLQAVSDFDMARGAEAFDDEFEVLERMARAAGGRPLSISLLQRDQAPGQWQRVLERASAASRSGAAMRVQVAPRGIGVLLGLDVTFHPFIGFPTFKKVAQLPLAERVAELRRPEVRTAVLGETSDKVAGDGSNVPPLADLLLQQIGMASFRFFRLGRTPDYEPHLRSSLGAEALRTGASPLALIYDALLEDDGKQLLYFPIYNYAAGSLDDVETMVNHPLALAGLGHGGAHVGTTCDASFPTFWLMHWARDRQQGRLPLAQVVRRLTGEPAAYHGLHDRGLLAPGRLADLNIFDLERLALGRPHVVRDLPAGGRRLLQDSQGYRATIKRGRVVRENGRATGELPGRVVRLGR
jgi:N-acyl-D-aspartate/D-glutamate deacylase